MSDGVEAAAAILAPVVGDRLIRGQPLAPLTTFRIGGPAALYLEPDRDDDLLAAGAAIRASDIPFVVIGKGSNVLVADRGFPGLVLRLGRGYRWAARDGDRLSAGGAMPLPALAGVALRHGLGGLEFGVAIPGTLGGGVRMNAGAHGHELAEVVEAVDVVRLLAGSIDRVRGTDAGFTYRRSDLGEDAVVTVATTKLIARDPRAIRTAMDEARAWRRETQPLAEPNCGSVFKNPPADAAARLIEAAGAKGRRVGGAQVSIKHANFVVAGKGATADDVWELIRQVRALVLSDSGIDLEPEVQVVGELGDGGS